VPGCARDDDAPQVDLALNPFEAELPALVDVAVAAEAHGVDGLWTADHFSGAVVDRRWSRDPFVTLGAVAHATTRVRVGPLVANIRNRHAAQLASAANSLQSLAPGRVVLGVGSGAAPGSRFAVEHEAIGTELGTAGRRRELLESSIIELRRTFESGTASTGSVGADSVSVPRGVTDGSTCPPIIVGASARATVDVALGQADGINLRFGSQVPELVAHARNVRGADFEVSVLVWHDIDRGALHELRDAGVDRVVIGVLAEHGVGQVEELLDRVWSDLAMR